VDGGEAVLPVVGAEGFGDLQEAFGDGVELAGGVVGVGLQFLQCPLEFVSSGALVEGAHDDAGVVCGVAGDGGGAHEVVEVEGSACLSEGSGVLEVVGDGDGVGGVVGVVEVEDGAVDDAVGGAVEGVWGGDDGADVVDDVGDGEACAEDDLFGVDDDVLLGGGGQPVPLVLGLGGLGGSG